MLNSFPMNYPMFPYQPATTPQAMTPPTIHADIIQVGSEQEAWNEQVAAGASKMMITRDESLIFIKSAYPDRQPTLDVYRKEEQKPAPSGDYVTKEELAEILKGLKRPTRAAKEKEENDESV